MHFAWCRWWADGWVEDGLNASGDIMARGGGEEEEWSILFHRSSMNSFTIALFLSYSLFAMCILCSGELLDFVWYRW